MRDLIRGADAVFHAATLHKPHVATHDMRSFIDTNVTGTLTLLEEAIEAGISSFIFTSTTSVFGAALRPPAGEPAVWVTEELAPVPRNIYGVTKAAAEDPPHPALRIVLLPVGCAALIASAPFDALYMPLAACGEDVPTCEEYERMPPECRPTGRTWSPEAPPTSH